MRTHTFTFEGFDIEVEQEALWGLIMSNLPGKDLRSAQRVIDQIFLELLLRAQSLHGQRIAGGSGPLEFHLRAAPDLKDHCAKRAQECGVRVHLVTHDRRLVDAVRSMLPDLTCTLTVSAGFPAAGAIPAGDLLLVDSLPQVEGPKPVNGLDRMVQRHLVDAATYRMLTAQESTRAIPLGWNPKKGPVGRQRCAMAALGSALDEARFSATFARARALNQRWKTRMEITVPQNGNLVNAVLKFNGVERVIQARDLKLDIGWGDIPETRLKDVLGLASPKERIREYLTWLKDPRGTPGLKAAVLLGPPGTGKTHLALAAAGEAGAPCIIVNASTFHDKFYGETERKIRETFAAAQKYSEVVMVVDELDALAWSREQSNDWMAQTQAAIMGALLTAIDKLRGGPGRVLLLCTTNQFHKIDAALTRSLRLGEKIHVALPGLDDRRAILVGLLGPDLCTGLLDEATTMTAGMSPADLIHLASEAMKMAAHGGSGLTMDHMRQAVFHSRSGEVDTTLHLSADGKERVAYHESGHALLAHDLLGPGSVAHLSVIPTAQGALGAAYLSKPDSAEILDRSRLQGHLAVLLGGKAGENCRYPQGGAGGGVASDLLEATRLASQAIMAWGFDDSLPSLALEGLPVPLQNVVAPRIVARIQAWISEAETVAIEHLAQNRIRLDRLAEGLLRAETLHGHEIKALLAPETP